MLALQTLMPLERDPVEQEEDEQVGMAWTNWSEHMILKMAAAKVVSSPLHTIPYHTIQPAITVYLLHRLELCAQVNTELHGADRG